MGAIRAKGDDQVSPSSFVHDGNGTAAVNNGRGPYICGVEYWVDVADPVGAAGSAWGVEFQYEDPTGTVITIGGGPIAIDSVGGRYRSFFEPVSRNTPTSLFRIVGTLLGSAGSSLVSWRVILLPNSPSDVLSW